MVTNVYVRVDPPVISVACDSLPQVVTINVEITASGPSTVTWHWESSTGIVSPDKPCFRRHTKWVGLLSWIRSATILLQRKQLPNIVTVKQWDMQICPTEVVFAGFVV
jgi:hypothetical protein